MGNTTGQIRATGTVVAASKASDLALLSVAMSGRAEWVLRLASSESEMPADGSAVLSVGCDLGKGAICATVNIVTRKRVRRQAGESAVAVWEIDRPSTEGHSGGPLIDSAGCLIGVASGNSGGRGYYVDILEIQQFLLREGFRWLMRQ